MTCRTDSAAPPRASPSSLASTTPVMPTPSRNASAVVTASWPIIASITKIVSSGWTASRIAAACAIISSSIPSRPAVSTITTSRMARLACSTEARATATGSPTPLPGSGANTSTLARSPSTWSCWTALGRCRSAATSSGWLPCSRRCRASLPASVVLPEPCRPASMITVGGCLAKFSRRASPPRTVTSSSCTILMTCWAGFSACDTSLPRARSLIPAMNARTTGSATSASSSASRISRAARSMSASDSRPLPRSWLKIPVSRSLSASNTSNRPWSPSYRSDQNSSSVAVLTRTGARRPAWVGCRRPFCAPGRASGTQNGHQHPGGPL